MGIYSLKPAFRRALSPLARLMIRAGVSADAITASGLVFAALAGLGVWLGREAGGWILLVPVGAFLRTAANALDGMVATTTGTARPLGDVFNEVADRVGDVAVLLPFALVADVNDVLVAGTIAATLVTSYLGMAVKAAGGPRVYTGIMAKPDRMFVVGVAAIVGFVFDDPGAAFTAALWIILSGVGITFLLRVAEAKRRLART
ncbi:MAG: CDP-alcohol phosphatidyltransferase family protein [Acidobacteria bacterium]|nr:CDP-alcohol phosphatidyltransferase family protein [Acidobacteriota bacterium]